MPLAKPKPKPTVELKGLYITPVLEINPSQY